MYTELAGKGWGFWERWMTSYSIARTEQHFGGGFKKFFDQFKSKRLHPTYTYMRKWLHWIFCTVASEHCFPVQRTRLRFCLQRMKPHIGVWYLGGSRVGYRKPFCTSVFYFLLLLYFTQRRSEKWCMYRGAALAITRDVMPITFIGL